jgi:glycosyltransferase involved in cell wall biosynthesis
VQARGAERGRSSEPHTRLKRLDLKPHPERMQQAHNEARPRLKILVLAYSISPIRGSEYSVGWNHVRNLSTCCDLTVLYGLAGPHMGDFHEIENHLANNGALPNVRFVAIRPNFFARAANVLNRHGFLIYSFYVAYRVWHHQAARCARELAVRERFDLIHYLCPIGYREPGFLWKSDIPYVWGPIGGLVPTRYLRGAPSRRLAKVRVVLKNWMNSIQLLTSRRVPKALRRVDQLVAATTENQAALLRHFNVESRHIPENAIPDEWISRSLPARLPDDDAVLNIIWIGSLDHRKSPDLLLDAISQLSGQAWRLHIVGEGPLAAAAKIKAVELGIQAQVTFHGLIDRSAVLRLLARSDLHMVTSMAEGNPTTIWEAMAVGVPTLALDHCGMHDVICDLCGIRVPLSDYSETCRGLAAAVETLLQDRGKLAILGKGLLTCRQRHLWSHRCQEWLEVYRRATSDHE